MFWYISATALVLSLLFSLRQKVAIEDFAPFVVIALPIMIKTFMHSFRVRLKQFRTSYNIWAISIISVLVLNFIIFVFNKPVYLILENANKHFANDYHIAKELAQQLHLRDINNIRIDSKELKKRLQFYNINEGDNYRLSKFIIDKNYETIEIKYLDKVVAKYYLYKK
jgi:hypothetical protein